MKPLILTLLCCLSVSAQSLGKVIVVGDAAEQDAARVEMLTQSPVVTAIQNTTFNFTNGPAGEEDYKNNTFYLGYNSSPNGTKLVAGEVNFALAHEPKFRNGTRGVGESNFQTEIYYTWTDRAGQNTIRPWGMNIQHDDASVQHVLQGELWFFRNIGNGGGPAAQWKDDGTVDLSYLPTGATVFKNNSPASGGIRWRSAFSGNTIAPIYLDDQDRVRIAAGGQTTIIGGPVETTDTYNVDGVQVLGNQCPAIPDTNGTLADNQRAINALLQCLRTHGAVATGGQLTKSCEVNKRNVGCATEHANCLADDDPIDLSGRSRVTRIQRKP